MTITKFRLDFVVFSMFLIHWITAKLKPTLITRTDDTK